MKRAFHALWIAGTSLLLGCAAPSVQRVTKDHDGFYLLPKVPAGCDVHLLGPIPRSFFPSASGDCIEFMRANGLQFPRGGFAFRDPKTGMLIVCTTQSDFELITATYHCN